MGTLFVKACLAVVFHVQVDGDTSTNDTVIALASGLSGAPRISSLDSHEAEIFQASLDAVTVIVVHYLHLYVPIYLLSLLQFPFPLAMHLLYVSRTLIYIF